MRVARAGPRFLGLPPLPPEVAPACCVIPVPWERSASYRRGTAEGPAAILRASAQVELYDEELGAETWRAGIETLEPVRALGSDPEGSLEAVAAQVEAVLGRGALPLLLGGEHTLTVGAVRAVARRHPGLVVLQIDAHADLRDAYEGDRWSHACVMARVREVCPHVGVGIRALSRPEAERARAAGWRVWSARDCRWPGWVEAVVGTLTSPVYVSVDLDAFDPSVIPGVGTPEPGGLGWDQVLGLLRRCAARHTIVGADVVEYCPAADPAGYGAFAAARLAYRLLGYVVTAGGTRACPRRLQTPEPEEP